MSSSTPTLRTLAAALGSVLVMAQSPAPAPQVPVAPATKESEGGYNKDFKTKLFVLQNRSSYQMRDILRPLTSGAKGAVLDATERDGLRTLSVRDFPENLAVLEAALQRLDMPAPARKTVELHLQVLFGSKQPGPSEGFPEELKAVLASLKSTLAYRSYTPAISFVQRLRDGSSNLQGRGLAEGTKAAKGGTAEPDLQFDWGIRNLDLETQPNGSASVCLKGFSVDAKAYNRSQPSLAVLGTDLVVKDGEQVVVGTTVLRDRGLIVVVSVRLVD